MKEQVQGRAGILGDNTIEAQIESGAGCRVYAHVAHGAADDQSVNAQIFQDFQQGRIAKTVWIILDDNGFTLPGSNPVVYFRAIGIRQEKESVRWDGNMPDMNDSVFFILQLFLYSKSYDKKLNATTTLRGRYICRVSERFV